MYLQHQTVLITGGSSGIGLEMARQLIQKQNKVIICGRSVRKLEQARQLLPELHVMQCDIVNETERQFLLEYVQKHHPECNILINNAAIVHKTQFRMDEEIIEKAALEINTNLLAPIALSKLFLPLIEKNRQPALINITTGLVYAPRAVYPIYNATKAALHSFTQVLRKQLEETPVKVVEVMMPVVDTPWHKGEVPKIAISPGKAVNGMLKQLQKGRKEIRVGASNLLYALSRIAPAFAFKKINEVQ